jgi:hypothetical protein
MLTIIGEPIIKGKKRAYYPCRCECGVVRLMRQDGFTSGKVMSCGCKRKPNYKFLATIPGKSGSRMYRIWEGIIQRCENEKSEAYRLYGARGVRICEKWRHSFQAFCEDMGEPPTSKHSIDRIMVDGNYEPGNCRWATQTEQMNNTRSNVYAEHNGIRKTVTEWSRIIGIGRDTVVKCLRERKMNIGEIMERYADNGKTLKASTMKAKSKKQIETPANSLGLFEELQAHPGPYGSIDGRNEIAE